MDFKQTKALYERMHSLIKRKATGTPEAFAERLGIGQSSLYRYLKALREEYHAPITYDKQKCRYCYSEDFELVL